MSLTKLCTKCHLRSIEPARVELGLTICYQCALTIPRKKGMMVSDHKTALEIQIMHPDTYEVAKSVFARRAGKACNLGKSMNGSGKTAIFNEPI
jgi:hypothetical protein